MTGPSVAEITNNPDIPFIYVGFKSYREPVFNPLDGEWINDYSTPCFEYNADSVNKDGAWYFAYSTAFLGLLFGGGGLHRAHTHSMVCMVSLRMQKRNNFCACIC